MPYSRRHFLRTGALLTACGISGLDALADMKDGKKPRRTIAADDEAYWAGVRDMFPLSREWAYLNNGTIGPSPYPVIEATRAGMMEADVIGAYGGYEIATGRIAGFVGAQPDEIALTHNTTEGINIACWGLPLKRGDEVIVSNQEHVGNAFPWLNRRKLHGIVLKVLEPADTADETLNRLQGLISKKTRVIALPHIPCTQGQVLPVAEICRLARTKGIFTAIDGAHGAGMFPLDMRELGCDTYASCCHKWMLGPKGTGFLYVRKDFQETLQPYFVGGGGDTGSWNMATDPITDTAYAPSAHRYYGGSWNQGLAQGIVAAIDFLEQIGMEQVHQRIMLLSNYTREQLAGLGEKVTLLTPAEERSRGGINGFRIKGVAFNEFFNRCMKEWIRIRGVQENGLNSLRVSTHIYNSYEDVDRLIREIRAVI